MKISKSKQELARIISENGGWGEGNHAIQDKDDKCVWFMTKMTGRPSGKAFWPGCKSDRIKLDKLLPNWHQTVLSHAEYLHLYPAPDADGWIEWSGGECPVSGDPVVDVKFMDGETAFGHSNEWIWSINDVNGDIVAYRLHEPEQVETVEYNYPGVVYTGPVQSEFVVDEKPTLDKLLQDWCNADDYAQRKQAEADEAAAMRDERWKELQARAGEMGVTVGLVVSVAHNNHELVITDWRDLQLNDIIEYVDGDIKDKIGMIGPVVEFAPAATNGMMVIMKCDSGPRKGQLGWPMKWRFIRRP